MLLRESRTSRRQRLPQTKKGIEFSEDEEEEYEEEEDDEEEEEGEEKDFKKGKVQSSVWWFVENVVRPVVCLLEVTCLWFIIQLLHNYAKNKTVCTLYEEEVHFYSLGVYLLLQVIQITHSSSYNNK